MLAWYRHFPLTSSGMIWGQCDVRSEPYHLVWLYQPSQLLNTGLSKGRRSLFRWVDDCYDKSNIIFMMLKSGSWSSLHEFQILPVHVIVIVHVHVPVKIRVIIKKPTARYAPQMMMMQWTHKWKIALCTRPALASSIQYFTAREAKSS